MSFLGNIFGSAIGKTVKDLGEGVSSLAIGLRTAITGIDPQKEAELKAYIVEAESLANQAQTEINKIEAGHKSIFIAGWRPFIGWVCGIALAFNFLLNPMIIWITQIFKIQIQSPPVLDMSQLFPLIMALLGLGAMRSYEKNKKVQDKH